MCLLSIVMSATELISEQFLTKADLLLKVLDLNEPINARLILTQSQTGRGSNATILVDVKLGNLKRDINGYPINEEHPTLVQANRELQEAIDKYLLIIKLYKE